MKKILMIDDDQDLGRLVSDYLETEGFRCTCLNDGQSGLIRALEEKPPFDLIILDIMLPVKNGFEVLEALRKSADPMRVIMLTAKGDPVDKIVGLEMGADDYMGKPFNPRELLARIRAVLRRSAPPPKGRLHEAGDRAFQMDEDQLSAVYHGRPLNLTVVEFKLLHVFVKNRGRIVSREKLFKEALGRREHAYDRSLDMHISRLRKKIWPDLNGAATERLKSVRGEGYLLTPERSAE